MKRKMLSTKNSTSWPRSSRKNSAIGHAGQADAQARARRLVHLAEHHHRLRDDARLGHLAVEVVALARALAHAGEHREAAVLGGDVADQLLDEHGLADAGAAEQADLAALLVRREQVDDLDAGLEDLPSSSTARRTAGAERWIGIRLLELDGAFAVDGLAEEVEDPTRGIPRPPAPRWARRCRPRPCRGRGRRSNSWRCSARRCRRCGAPPRR